MKRLTAILIFLILILCASCDNYTHPLGSDNTSQNETTTESNHHDIATNEQTEVCKHKFNEWVVEESPSCNKEGTKASSCALCDEKTFKAIPMLYHNIENDVCVTCGQKAASNLAFENLDNNTCAVVGIGSCMDDNIIVPSKSPSGKIVSEIKGEAFANLKNLKSLTLPGSITVVRSFAIYKCPSLKTIGLCNGINKIMFSAIYECTALEELYFPQSVVLEPAPAVYCVELVAITVDNSNPAIYSETNCIIDKSNMYVIAGCGTSVIPEDVTGIEMLAFYGCNNIVSIDIPDSVTYIGRESFAYCSSLKSIEFPQSVKEIYYSATYGCSAMEYIIYPEGLSVIEARQFGDCKSLTHVYFRGTEAEWNALKLKDSYGDAWNKDTKKIQFVYEYNG